MDSSSLSSSTLSAYEYVLAKGKTFVRKYVSARFLDVLTEVGPKIQHF